MGTPASRRRSCSFDHLVGAGEYRGRDGESERLGGLEIDDQLECRWLLDRQFGGLGAVEGFSGVNAELAIDSREARPIADQAAGSGELARIIDRPNPPAWCQRHHLVPPDKAEPL